MKFSARQPRNPLQEYTSGSSKKMKTYKTKKSLGQNFLKSELALKKIIETGEIKKDDIILEIGPGKGVLTEKFLEKA